MSSTLLKPEEIAAVLRAHGWMTESDQVRLLPDGRGSGRRGVVNSGIWFRVDRDLHGLAAAAREFHQACPAIAAKPIFYFDHGGLQWFGCEHSGDEELREDQLVHAVAAIKEALGATEQPSTAAAGEAEIDSFLAALCEVQEFSLLDREMLLRYVGNELKARLVTVAPITRWAHGNLTTDSIRMDETGRIRVMEAEFAQRTHFFDEDWVRLGRCGAQPAALRAYSWLREIMIDRKSVRPNLARALTLLDGSGQAIRASMLAHVAGGMGTPRIATADGRAQLYASQSELFTEDTAATVEFPRNGWDCVRFVLALGEGNWNLRLDPASETGFIEIRRVSVSHDRAGERFSSDLPGLILEAGGTCKVLRRAPALLLLSYGDDPQVRLPRIAIDSGGELTVEIWMRWLSAEMALLEYGPVLELHGTSVP